MIGMHHKTLWRAMLAVGCLAGWSGAWGDRIRFHDGREIEGEIVGRERHPSKGEVITIAVGSARITYPAGQIKEIVPATAGEKRLRGAAELMQGGQADEAMLALGQACAGGATPEEAASFIEANADAIAGKGRGLTSPARLALEQGLALAETAKTPASKELNMARVQLHTMLGDPAKATEILDKLEPDFFTTKPHLRERLSRWLLGWLADELKAGNMANIAPALENLKRVDPAMAKARQTQFYMQWAAKEREAENWEEALRIYAEQLMVEAPMIAKDRIDVTLSEAESKLSDRDQLAQAAALYEKFGLPNAPVTAREKLVQIWRNQGWRLMRDSDYAGAHAAFENAAKFCDGCVKRDLLQVEYHERLAAAKPDNQQGYIDLALWCKEQGLNDEALLLFKRFETDPDVGEAARTHIDQILQEQAEKELAALMDEFEAGHYEKVFRSVQEVIGKDYPEAVLRQAMEIEKLARDALSLQQSAPALQAEKMFQRAQAAYQQKRYQEAESLLKAILDHYKNTLVYARAQNYYALVRDKLVLEQLEKGSAAAASAEGTSQTQTMQPAAADPASSMTTATQTNDEGTTRGEINKLLKALNQMDEKNK